MPSPHHTGIDSGYIGNAEKWRAFLRHLSQRKEFAGTDQQGLQDALDPTHTEDLPSAITDFETANIILPKSYRDFILAGGVAFTNHLRWSLYDMHQPTELFFAPAELMLMGQKYPLTGPDSKTSGPVYKDDRYYIYPNYQDDLDHLMKLTAVWKYDRFSHLWAVARIDDVIVLCLNAADRMNDGEFEAWQYGDMPSLVRYRSFAELYINSVIFPLSREAKDNYEPAVMNKNDLIDYRADLILDIDILIR